jgi:PAS domain S-box-containing protein
MPSNEVAPSSQNGHSTRGLKSSRGTGLNAKLAQENAKLAQENARLAQERDLLRTLFDSLPDNLFIKDRQSRFLTSNLAHVRTLGATRPDEVTGKTDLDIFPAELANQYYGDEQALMESGQPLNREETVVNPRTGEKRWLQTTKIPLRDKNGKVVGVMGINRDITDRKQMEEALRQSRDELEQRVIKRTAELSAKNAELAQTNEARASAHRLLQAMLDNVPDRIYFKDTESRFIQCNRAVAKRVGVEEPKQVIGKTDFDFYPREKAEEFRKDDQKLIQSGEALLNKTEQVIKPNGEITWSSVTKVPLRDENGKAVGLVGISRDITERKQAEEALARERLLLRTLIDNLPDGIYAKDTACRKTLVNPADLKNLCCKSEAEALGKSDFDFYPRDLAEKFYADDQNVLQGQPVINREEYVLDEKGEKRWLMTSKLPLRDQNGKIVGLVGVGRDITHRKQAEEALRQSEERLREVMQHTHCILHSGQVEGLEGWRERALDPVSPFHWDLPVQNEETAQEIFPLELAPGEQYQQGWYRTWNRADHIQMNRNSGNALLNDLPFYRNEFRCTDKHEVEHWMQQFVTIHKLAENRWQLFCITTDITDLKATESALRSSEEKLRQFTVQLERSNRELQDFAYVASHDLQEPLRKIVVFGERLREKNSEALGPEALDYLERMQKAAGRMQTLINDLLTFSRVTTKAHPFAPANLAEIASEVVNDLEGRIELVKGRVELGTLPVIDAEALQMRQLLQNLIGNALKFRRPEEPPVVKVEAQIIPDPITPAKKLCRLTVSDNCIGFDEKYLDRIFNVFQRLHTRNEYEGTGMGLAIVRKIALYHGGDITAKSKLGQGSTFILTLPVVHPKKAQDENKETTMNKETTTNNK